MTNLDSAKQNDDDNRYALSYEYYDTLVDINSACRTYGVEALAKDLLNNYPELTLNLANELNRILIQRAKIPALFKEPL